MKKIISFILVVLMIATVFCGCSEEHNIKVSKNGKTKIGLSTFVPVDFVEDMEEQMGTTTEDLQEDDPTGMSTGGEYASELDDMVIKTVDGEKYYVGEDIQSFSSTTKATKYMIDTYGKNAGGYFKTFKVTTKTFNATVMDSLIDTMELTGMSYGIKLTVTLPYTITKTNGTLSADKKTVSFDVLKNDKLYAYTVKSAKSAKIYFKKDYLKTNDTAYLSWNSVKGAQKYVVQYKASSDKKWNKTTTKKTEKLVKNLKAGKKYTFKVTAVTKSKKYTSINTYITPLKKVTATVKSKTSKSVKLSWKKNTDADGYIVYQKTTKSGSWKKVKTVKDPYTATCTIKSLKSNKKYYFKVVSYSKENGKVIKSSGATVTTKTK